MKAEQLRKSILQMAIQGKLVPQDPNDEPASVLLERIRAEKQKLIKEGKIKKDKNDSIIFRGDDNRHYEKIGDEVKDITDELPFEIPDNWMWVRLPDIVYFELGKTPDRHTDRYWNTGVYPWFSISDMVDKSIAGLTKEKISAIALTEKFDSKLVPKGTLLMSFKLTIGRTTITDVDCVHNEAIISIYPHLSEGNVIRDFLFKTLGLLVHYVNQTEAIKGATLNSSKIKTMLVPLPPLAEQKRLFSEIEKYEPLLAEYDKLEQQATKLDDEIYNKLKKSILQYAIQGKLVPQDPNDEPASVLLERIRAEKKAKLGKKYVESYIFKGEDNCYYEKVGGIAKNITDELPFEIPDSWGWARLGDIYQHNTGKALNSSNINGIKLKYITTSNLYWNSFQLSNIKEMPFTDTEIEKCTVTSGDLLVCEGGDIGRSAIWNFDYDICIQNHIHRLRAYKADLIDNRFFMWCLYVYKSCGLIGGKGIGIQGLSSNALDNLLLPIPTTKEQYEILNRIKAYSISIDKGEN